MENGDKKSDGKKESEGRGVGGWWKPVGWGGGGKKKRKKNQRRKKIHARTQFRVSRISAGNVWPWLRRSRWRNRYPAVACYLHTWRAGVVDEAAEAAEEGRL